MIKKALNNSVTLPQLYLPNPGKVLEHWMVEELVSKVNASMAELKLLLKCLKEGLEHLPSEREELGQDEYEFYTDLYNDYIALVENGLGKEEKLND